MRSSNCYLKRLEALEPQLVSVTRSRHEGDANQLGEVEDQVISGCAAAAPGGRRELHLPGEAEVVVRPIPLAALLDDSSVKLGGLLNWGIGSRHRNVMSIKICEPGRDAP